jgi:hypothetical protein
MDANAVAEDLDQLQAEAEALTEQARTSFKTRQKTGDVPTEKEEEMDASRDTERFETSSALNDGLDSTRRDDLLASPPRTAVDLDTSDVGSRTGMTESPFNRGLAPGDDGRSIVTTSEAAGGANRSLQPPADDEDELQDEEDEDDDPEPLLKYSRLGGNLGNLLAKDTVSCICVSDRFVVRLLRVAHIVQKSAHGFF